VRYGPEADIPLSIRLPRRWCSGNLLRNNIPIRVPAKMHANAITDNVSVLMSLLEGISACTVPPKLRLAWWQSSRPLIRLSQERASYRVKRVDRKGSDIRTADVRFGSKADVCAAKSHVRFTPKSGHSAA